MKINLYYIIIIIYFTNNIVLKTFPYAPHDMST